MAGVARSQGELFKQYNRRITALERRLASRGDATLPARLSVGGREVTDWNDATQPGFYWAKTGALNSAFDNDYQSAWVTVDGNGRVVQSVMDVRTTADAYRGTLRRMGYPNGDGTYTWTAWSVPTVPWSAVTGTPAAFPTTWATITGKPTGFSDVPPTVADLNAVVGPGWVTSQGGVTANSPDSGLWWTVQTTNSGGRATQYAWNIDRTGVVYKRWLVTPGDTSSWSPWVAVSDERAPVLPGIYTAGLNGALTITATAWAVLPTRIFVDVVLPVDAYVSVSFGAWMIANAGDTRMGVALSGATTEADPAGFAGASGRWGLTGYMSNAVTAGNGTIQTAITRHYKFNAGTTRAEIYAYQVGGGTHNVNYPVLQALAVRPA